MASPINNTLSTPSVRGLVSPQTPTAAPMMGNMTPTIPPVSTAPIGALGGTVKSHSITVSPDGTQKHTVAYDNGQKTAISGLVSPQAAPKVQKTTAPTTHFINGKHYVPFKTAQGKIAHINADGQIIT